EAARRGAGVFDHVVEQCCDVRRRRSGAYRSGDRRRDSRMVWRAFGSQTSVRTAVDGSSPWIEDVKSAQVRPTSRDWCVSPSTAPNLWRNSYPKSETDTPCLTSAIVLAPIRRYKHLLNWDIRASGWGMSSG